MENLKPNCLSHSNIMPSAECHSWPWLYPTLQNIWRTDIYVRQMFCPSNPTKSLVACLFQQYVRSIALLLFGAGSFVAHRNELFPMCYYTRWKERLTFLGSVQPATKNCSRMQCSIDRQKGITGIPQFQSSLQAYYKFFSNNNDVCAFTFPHLLFKFPKSSTIGVLQISTIGFRNT